MDRKHLREKPCEIIATVIVTYRLRSAGDFLLRDQTYYVITLTLHPYFFLIKKGLFPMFVKK